MDIFSLCLFIGLREFIPDMGVMAYSVFWSMVGSLLFTFPKFKLWQRWRHKTFEVLNSLSLNESVLFYPETISLQEHWERIHGIAQQRLIVWRTKSICRSARIPSLWKGRSRLCLLMWGKEIREAASPISMSKLLKDGSEGTWKNWTFCSA